ncbi:DNA-binding CsgD family transcriptional regulator [Saccharothrix tamanrassetensis]|uniref:DNA-binding CsgD family transcriptional regulator n=1 Tax=Saccharothrix tamanrassetensis TaxID=1051531 RepID=A0A841CVV1_9PSEU|nr:helix-turn-helix transcriptional regulator [Saccharothrix tamanrassetensis]MBB5960085.1 DNA-binding CsgD family transcriptional regulator [Saccharothrix tamanrassetensis]
MHDDGEIAALERDLVLGARREYRRLTGDVAASAQADRGALIGVRRRTICALPTEGADALAAQDIAHDDEVRVLAGRPPAELLIVDDVAVVRLATGALVVRTPVLSSLLADYFEHLWDRAVPLADDGVRPAGGLTAVQRRILRLAAEGFKDDSIARVLGLSSRSVRRHMEKLAARAGASNRLTLGAAAARLGWI